MRDENGEEYIPLANGKRMYLKDSMSMTCPACGLFRKESRICVRCHRKGCENCVSEVACMACDFGEEVGP